jgi:NAD-dependent deacetylase
MTKELEKFQSLLTDSERVAVFTGAGISTESGIPDFRGPNGLWSRFKPTDYQQFISSEKARQESWQQWFEHRSELLRGKPNAGHYAVANLVGQGKVAAVITQNIDNLHQASGITADRVIELHGNATYAKCLDCDRRIEIALLEREYRKSGGVGPCAECGGVVKLATISFGQMMPEEPMRRAEEETLACDLFLVMGSSLTVYPAAAFPEVAYRNGAKLVIVNQQPTAMDSVAELVIHAGIGDTMTAVLARA